MFFVSVSPRGRRNRVGIVLIDPLSPALRSGELREAALRDHVDVAVVLNRNNSRSKDIVTFVKKKKQTIFNLKWTYWVRKVDKLVCLHTSMLPEQPRLIAPNAE